jgi:hypothetical protein
VPPSSIVVNRVSASSFALWLVGKHGDNSSEGARMRRNCVVAMVRFYPPALAVTSSDPGQPTRLAL